MIIIIIFLILWVWVLYIRVEDQKRLIDENSRAIWHLNSRMLKYGPHAQGTQPDPNKEQST